MKPEVHRPDTLQRRRSTTESRPQVARAKTGEDWTCSFGDMLADRHKHADNNIPVTVLRFPAGGGEGIKGGIGKGGPSCACDAAAAAAAAGGIPSRAH